MKLRILFITITLAALFGAVPAAAAAGSARPAHSAAADQPAAIPTPAGGLTSSVWGGWIDLAHKNVQLYSVTATFKVPRTTCPVKHALTYLWVGLDGWGEKTVEQDGVAAYCGKDGGRAPEYYDWYEMFPKKPVPKHFVHTGDTIVATVSYDSRNHKYLLKVTDKNHPGADISVAKSCNRGTSCLRKTAEVVAEDPGGGPKNHHYLADFRRVAFSKVRVTSRDGSVGHLGSTKLWTADKITMAYKGRVMAVASRRRSGNTAFSVGWKGRG
jgi:hypothetical protein